MIPHYKKLLDKFKKPKEKETRLFSKKHQSQTDLERERARKSSTHRYKMMESENG